MNIYLAALGWIAETPEGNRLRWAYPVDAVDANGDYLGLPKTIVVERAWLDEDIPHEYPQEAGKVAVSGTIPYGWWDHHGTVSLNDLPWITFDLPGPVQAARFTYQGPATRLVVYDEDGRAVTERMLAHNQFFYHEAPSMQQFEFLTFSATLKDFSTVDLFADRGLDFETIAVIHVAETVNASLAQVAPRYTIPPTLTPSEWEEFVEFAKQAMASSPDDPVDDETTPWWTAFKLAMGLRWEHAALFGHGFVDGPHGEASELDEVAIDLLLQQPPDTAVAYRVLDGSQKLSPSNLVVCPPWLANPLGAPHTPVYVEPEVRLTEDPETDEPFFEASLVMRWQQTDARALGVEVEETLGASPATGESGYTETYASRTRRPEDPPLFGEVARVFRVPFHDMPLSARARAVDGWDRVSAPSGLATTALKLIHAPQAPALASASYKGGTVRLTRQVGDPNYPDWQPDLVVQHDPGAKVFVYRRDSTQPAATAAATASTPVPVSGGRYRTTLSGGPGSLSPFVEGYLIAPAFKAAITGVSGNDVFFEAGDQGGGAVPLFAAGPVTLQQSPKALSLWQKVAEFPAAGLPDELAFPEPLPAPTGKADVLSYYTRVSFLSRIGPAGNAVQAWRIPSIPATPPPFTVELLGIDFYNRTLVKVRLTNPQPGGTFTVWWASGTPPPAEFGSKAVPGEYRAQPAQEGRYLFDVLAIPIPQTVNRTITIGVQQVNEGGGQSDFAVVPVVLPAIAPTP